MEQADKNLLFVCLFAPLGKRILYKGNSNTPSSPTSNIRTMHSLSSPSMKQFKPSKLRTRLLILYLAMSPTLNLCRLLLLPADGSIFSEDDAKVFIFLNSLALFFSSPVVSALEVLHDNDEDRPRFLLLLLASSCLDRPKGLIERSISKGDFDLLLLAAPFPSPSSLLEGVGDGDLVRRRP